MQPSRKIVHNVLITAIRMLATAGLGLLATRLILTYLGEENFGLYALIAGGVSLVSLLATGLEHSIQRYLAFEIGRRKPERIIAVFSTATTVSVVFAVLVFAAGVAVMPLFLAFVKIPQESMTIARIAWLIILAMAALEFCLLSINAMFPAHQDLHIVAVFDACNTVARLLIAFLLPWIPISPLLAFVILLMVVQIVNGVIQTMLVLHRYPEVRWRQQSVQGALFKELCGFGSWQVLETSAQRIMRQGGALILNRFFGVTANAALSLALQLRGYLDRGATIVVNATHPAIISTYASGRRERAGRLANLSSGINVFLMSLPAIPLLLETTTIVHLWLPNPPTLAVPFLRILILAAAANRLSVGYASLIAAHGRLRVYSSVLAVLAAAAIPMTYWLSDVNLLGANALTWSLALVAGVGTIFRTVYVSRLSGQGYTWVRQVLLPLILTVGTGLLVCLPVARMIHHPMLRLALITVTYSVAAAPIAWFLLLRREERQAVLDAVRNWQNP